MKAAFVSICAIWSFRTAGTSTCRSIWRIEPAHAAGAPGARQPPENNSAGQEPGAGPCVEHPTPGGVPPSPQPLTHPATDPGPFGRRGLLFCPVCRVPGPRRAGNPLVPPCGLASAPGWQTCPFEKPGAFLAFAPARNRVSARSRDRDPGLAYIRPTTRSSRCTISVRPLKPRIERMSGDDRRMILAASSAS